MVLIPQDQGWLLRLKTKQGAMELPLQSASLEAALIEAEQLYVDARVVTTGKVRCQQCIHWDLIGGRCSLGFPEGKRSGGKHAKDCAAFWVNPDA
jgi:hypothetical protein